MFKNKRVLIVVGIVILLLLIATFLSGRSGQTSNSSDRNPAGQSAGRTDTDETDEESGGGENQGGNGAAGNANGEITVRTACDFFTADVVRSALNKTAVVSGPGERPLSTNGVVATDCAYELQGTASITLASVILYSAVDSTAYGANVASFKISMRQTLDDKNNAQSEKLDKIGDDAYYNPDMRQVGVLIDGGKYWFVAQVTSGKTDSIAIAKELAKRF